MSICTLLTFDYEVYFGENYTTESKVLFNPTKKLLEISKKLEVKLVFFIDVMSVLAYDKYDNNFKTSFKEQIQVMKQLGHDIQLHFHPHWIDSFYDSKDAKWEHNYKNWSFSNLIDNKGVDKAKKILLEAQDLFIEMTGVKPIAFRAGGYTIQPHEEDLIKFLYDNQYKFDSSVFPLRKYHSIAQVFDFKQAPQKNYWKISSFSFLTTGKLVIYEIPIMVIKKNIKNLFTYGLFKAYNRFFFRPRIEKKRGSGATKQPSVYENTGLSFSFDFSSSRDKKIIKFITKEFIKKYTKEKNIFLNIVSHPKALNEDSLNMLIWYVNYMRITYQSTFIGFDDMEKLI